MQRTYFTLFVFFSVAILNALFVGAHAPSMLIVIYASLFIPYFLLVKDTKKGLLSWKTILIFGLAIRIPLTFIEPLLSDDIFRYLWEGRVVFEGLSPYANAPNAESLAFLRDTKIWPLINHNEIPAIYPPFAQFFFAAIALIGGAVTEMRLAFIGVELLGLVGLYKILRPYWTQNRLALALALYWLNPMIIYEIAWSGHLDVLAFIPLTLSLALLTYTRNLRWFFLAGFLMGLSVSAKFIGLILLPLIVFAPLKNTLSTRKFVLQRIIFLLVMFTTLGASYLPFVSSGHLLDGFGAYAKSWRNNESQFRLVEQSSSYILRGDSQDADPVLRFPQYDRLALRYGFTKTWEGKTIPNTSFSVSQLSSLLAKMIGALAMGLFLLFLLYHRRDIISASLLLIFFLYMIAPTVMPWYITWLIPLAALVNHKPSLIYSFIGLLGYYSWVSSRGGGPWSIPNWVIIIEYFIVLLSVVMFTNFQENVNGYEDRYFR